MQAWLGLFDHVISPAQLVRAHYLCACVRVGGKGTSIIPSRPLFPLETLPTRHPRPHRSIANASGGYERGFARVFLLHCLAHIYPTHTLTPICSFASLHPVHALSFSGGHGRRGAHVHGALHGPLLRRHHRAERVPHLHTGTQ